MSPTFPTVVFTRLVNSGKVKGYDDFFPIGLFGTAPYSLHARTPINSIADIKGKKIRASGAVESETIKALGAVPIGMPVTEVPEAIGRSTIDGTTSKFIGCTHIHQQSFFVLYTGFKSSCIQNIAL